MARVEVMEPVRRGWRCGSLWMERLRKWPYLPSLRLAPDDDRGQSLAELMIALMLMLYLIVGVLDLGRALHAYTVLVQATREAVMAAAGTPTGLLEAQTIFQAELARGGVNASAGTLSLQIELLGDPPLPTVVADASYTLPLLLPLAPVDSVTVSTHSAAVLMVGE